MYNLPIMFKTMATKKKKSKTMARLAQCLGLSCILQTLIRMSNMISHSCNPSAGEAETEAPWSSLASQSSLIRKLQGYEKLNLKESGWPS